MGSEVRYLLAPQWDRGDDFYRPRANSGVVLLAAGLDNLPPPPKWVRPSASSECRKRHPFHKVVREEKYQGTFWPCVTRYLFVWVPFHTDEYRVKSVPFWGRHLLIRQHRRRTLWSVRKTARGLWGPCHKFPSCRREPDTKRLVVRFLIEFCGRVNQVISGVSVRLEECIAGQAPKGRRAVHLCWLCVCEQKVFCERQVETWEAKVRYQVSFRLVAWAQQQQKPAAASAGLLQFQPFGVTGISTESVGQCSFSKRTASNTSQRQQLTGRPTLNVCTFFGRKSIVIFAATKNAQPQLCAHL